MRFITLGFLCLAHAILLTENNNDNENDEEDFEYVGIVDPVRRALAFAANTTKEARKLGGVFGLCADGLTLPDHSALICDPPNSLPQICTLACKQGYYNPGPHRDVACADAMCQGSCRSDAYECKGAKTAYGTKTCDFTRYTTCDAEESGMCLETVSEPCTYSFYEEVTRPCCDRIELQKPDDCWTSGCTGTCDKPGVYHYYSNKCGDVCPPWRTPDVPTWDCQSCRVPAELPPHVVVKRTNAVDKDPASIIQLGCETGYWGPSIESFCLSTDGSFYPPPNQIVCQQCSDAPLLEGELFERIQIDASTVEFRCLPGFMGEPTQSVCNPEEGWWSFVEPPYCEVASTPSVSVSASLTPSPSADPELATASPSSESTVSPTMTPSKTPRPPKVKGSRAPSPVPKLIA